MTYVTPEQIAGRLGTPISTTTIQAMMDEDGAPPHYYHALKICPQPVQDFCKRAEAMSEHVTVYPLEYGRGGTFSYNPFIFAKIEVQLNITSDSPDYGDLIEEASTLGFTVSGDFRGLAHHTLMYEYKEPIKRTQNTKGK